MLFVTECTKMAAVPLSAQTLPNANPLHVAVVEDDVACRVALVEAVNAAPDMRLQWAIATRAEALTAITQPNATPADVLLVDLGLPDGSGLEVIAMARQRWPDCVAMVSTIFGDEEHVLRAIQVGAMGYLLKDVAPPQVVEEIRLLAAGGSPISPMVARKLLVMRLSADSATPVFAATETRAEDRADSGADTGLSTREIEVRGHTLEEVARALSLSRHTVRTFVRRLYAKLQVSTRAQAVREGLRQGLL